MESSLPALESRVHWRSMLAGMTRCFRSATNRLENRRPLYSCDGEPEPRRAPAAAAPNGFEAVAGKRPPDGGSTGEAAPLDEAECGALELSWGRYARLMCCSGREDGAIMDYGSRWGWRCGLAAVGEGRAAGCGRGGRQIRGGSSAQACARGGQQNALGSQSVEAASAIDLCLHRVAADAADTALVGGSGARLLVARLVRARLELEGRGAEGREEPRSVSRAADAVYGSEGRGKECLAGPAVAVKRVGSGSRRALVQ